jgi:hypothetical protein
MQKDLDNNFTKQLQERNIKRQSQQMQKLRNMFDNAFTPD